MFIKSSVRPFVAAELKKSPNPMVAVAAIMATVAISAGRLVWLSGKDESIKPWHLSQFWVDYSDGFVRRGLPGTVMSFVAPRAYSSAMYAASLLVLAGVVTVFFAVRAATSGMVLSTDRLIVVAILVASPFTFSMLVSDFGRYDTVCWAVLIVVALWRFPGDRSSSWITSAGLGIAITVTVATLEISLIFIAPLVICRLVICGLRSGRLAWSSMIMLGPGLVVALASLLVHPRQAFLNNAVSRAHAAGLHVYPDSGNAITALAQSPADAVTLLGLVSPFTPIACTIVFGGCYFVTCVVLWQYFGRPDHKCYWAMVALNGCGAGILTLIGIDYRRWWTFAFFGAVGTLLMLGRSSISGPRLTTPVRQSIIAGFLIASLLGQFAPVYPRWEGRATASFNMRGVVGSG